jgi:hypothetical protein
MLAAVSWPLCWRDRLSGYSARKISARPDAGGNVIPNVRQHCSFSCSKELLIESRETRSRLNWPPGEDSPPLSALQEAFPPRSFLRELRIRLCQPVVILEAGGTVQGLMAYRETRCRRRSVRKKCKSRARTGVEKTTRVIAELTAVAKRYVVCICSNRYMSFHSRLPFIRGPADWFSCRHRGPAAFFFGEGNRIRRFSEQRKFRIAVVR